MRLGETNFHRPNRLHGCLLHNPTTIWWCRGFQTLWRNGGPMEKNCFESFPSTVHGCSALHPSKSSKYSMCHRIKWRTYLKQQFHSRNMTWSDSKVQTCHRISGFEVYSVYIGPVFNQQFCRLVRQFSILAGFHESCRSVSGGYIGVRLMFQLNETVFRVRNIKRYK